MVIDPGGAAAAGAGAAAAAGAAIGASMKSLAKAAASGQFAISESGGEALLATIREMKDWVRDRRVDLEELRQAPPLGRSHGADTMRQYVPQVASDDQGFLTMLLKFRDSLDDAEQGINDAIRNYKALDGRSADQFKAK
jgi:hypothetical protein